MWRCTHEACENRLTRRHRITHQLDVKQGLQEGGKAYDPKQRETVFYDRSRTKEKLATADRCAKYDDAWSNSTEPSESFRARRRWQFGNAPWLKARARLRRCSSVEFSLRDGCPGSW